MKTVELGGQGLRVSVEGFGAMGMSAFYGARDKTESIATLNRAVDLGITLIDTVRTHASYGAPRRVRAAARPLQMAKAYFSNRCLASAAAGSDQSASQCQVPASR
jgi:aryl-alcohol dehydrogenase-like predicted oxidoreductase